MASYGNHTISASSPSTSESHREINHIQQRKAIIKGIMYTSHEITKLSNYNNQRLPWVRSNSFQFHNPGLSLLFLQTSTYTSLKYLQNKAISLKYLQKQSIFTIIKGHLPTITSISKLYNYFGQFIFYLLTTYIHLLPIYIININQIIPIPTY